VSGGSLDATLGVLSSDGVEVELSGGINFVPPLLATKNETTDMIDVTLEEGAIGGGEGGGGSSVRVWGQLAATTGSIVNGTGALEDVGAPSGTVEYTGTDAFEPSTTLFGLKYLGSPEFEGDVYVRYSATVTVVGSNASDSDVAIGIAATGVTPPSAYVAEFYLPQDSGFYHTINIERVISVNDTSGSEVGLSGLSNSYGAGQIISAVMIAEVLGTVA
jgi:hypothetical protein